MKSLFLSLAVVLVSNAFVHVSHADDTANIGTATVQDPLSEIRSNLESWLAAFNEKDIEGLLTHYDDETVYANANAPIIAGKQAIRERYSTAFASVQGTLKFKEEHAFIEEGMGLIIGKYYFEPGADAASEGGTGRVALVYRRQVDGSWGLLFDMDNDPPDVLPADFK